VPTPAPQPALLVPDYVFCAVCRQNHRSLLSPDGGDPCNPFAPGPEPQPEPPVDPLTVTIDMAAMEKEARRSRRR
jgi:hypothetical protein